MPDQRAEVTFRIDILARVEGETALCVRIPAEGGECVELRIFEPPRFFEGFLVGRRYDEVGDIVSRICGICPVSHMTTAILAVEKAMGVEVSKQTATLRRLGCLSQIIASHIVHLYALAMPDYVGADGLGEMLPLRREDVERMIRMRKVVNDMTALIGGGRALHPIAAVVGGFTRIAPPAAFAEIRRRLCEIRDDAERTVRLVAGLAAPEYSRPREFVALRGPDGYTLDGGRIVSTEGLDIAVEDYADHFEERQIEYAMAKQTRVAGRGGPMVGALARMHLNADRLSPRAAELAREVGFALPDHNPFHNNLAQAIEIVHGIDECIEALGRLEPVDERPKVTPAAGEGAAITEAPRGLLYHQYAVNRNGVIEHANLVTPTAHNFLSIEEDLRGLVAALADRPPDRIRMACEMLVRAYDPCFSCSVH